MRALYLQNSDEIKGNVNKKRYFIFKDRETKFVKMSVFPNYICRFKGIPKLFYN